MLIRTLPCFRVISWFLVIGVIIAACGCSGSPRRKVFGSSVMNPEEPVLNSKSITPGSETLTPETTDIETLSPATAEGFVDRHPLLRKPQQYFNNTNSNRAVKTAAAAFVGVPAGIVGELRQIVIGSPSTFVP